jgi:mannitol 2-dehydrogenase
MTALSNRTLKEIGDRVAVPTYDRAKVVPGIMHFGVGNFHRAHQAMYLDNLMNSGNALDWGICGVGVLPSDARMRDVLAAQDGLYTLTLRHADGRLEPRVIGSIVKYLFAPDDPEAVLRQLTEPATRIVSLTVTEGGYNNHPVTGKFDLGNQAIVDDAKSSNPSTIFGLIVEGLRRRRAAEVAPFTVMSCDNIQSNGDVAKAAFVAFAMIADIEIANWIDTNVAFPNSMVDRITPATTEADVLLVRDDFGIDDQWPVLSEPFKQWVLEESFTLGRPPYELTGVQVVDDVMPYELMKLRLLNVGHQALAYFGYLAGYRFAHEAMGDSSIRAFVRAYMDQDGTPTLLPVPGIDLETYKRQLIGRFSNPEVKDTLARLCADTSNRIPKWLVPVIRVNLDQDGDVSMSAAIIASWARYAEGIDEAGRPIEVVDALCSTLIGRARSYEQDELAFLRDRDLFGDLVDEPRFTEPYRATLRQLHEEGALQTLNALVNTSAATGQIKPR